MQIWEGPGGLDLPFLAIEQQYSFHSVFSIVKIGWSKIFPWDSFPSLLSLPYVEVAMRLIELPSNKIINLTTVFYLFKYPENCLLRPYLLKIVVLCHFQGLDPCPRNFLVVRL